MKKISAILVIVSLFSSSCWAEGNTNNSMAIENLRQTGKAFAEISKRISPGVVNIQTELEISNYNRYAPFNPFGDDSELFDPFSDDLLKRFFSGPPIQKEHPAQKQVITGQGSGFIIDTNGHIVTNSHVAKDASKILVKLQDGREFEAKVIGTDPQSDLAVIKINAKGLSALSLGNSDQLEVGEWILAVGNPFGLSHTITAGIVSAKGRSGMGITDYEDFIQTDAAINPGNSGGPLVNLEGQVVGVNIAMALSPRSGGYVGIGFAIPSNTAKLIADQLIDKGSVTRGYLGVYLQELTKDLAKSFGMTENKGILISQVVTNSPAEKSGLKRGDIILEIDGVTITSVIKFKNSIALSTPGTTHNLTILRDNAKKNIKIKIEKSLSSEELISQSSHNLEKIGIEVQDITPQIAERLELKNNKGVVIKQVNPDSIAARTGMKKGMVITEVNRKPVANVKEFINIVNNA